MSKGPDEMTEELTLQILREIAAPGSGHLFSRREAARSAIDLIEQQAARIAEYERKERSTARLLCRHGDGKLCIDGAALESAAKAEPFGWVKPAGGNYFTRSALSARHIGGMVPVYAAPVADSEMAKDAERYRWLRRRAVMVDASDDAVIVITLFKSEGPTGEFLDDQIDGEIAKEKR